MYNGRGKYPDLTAKSNTIVFLKYMSLFSALVSRLLLVCSIYRLLKTTYQLLHLGADLITISFILKACKITRHKSGHDTKDWTPTRKYHSLQQLFTVSRYLGCKLSIWILASSQIIWTYVPQISQCLVTQVKLITG